MPCVGSEKGFVRERDTTPVTMARGGTVTRSHRIDAKRCAFGACQRAALVDVTRSSRPNGILYGSGETAFLYRASGLWSCSWRLQLETASLPAGAPP